MGQYLSIGIITQLKINTNGTDLSEIKEDLKERGVDLDLYEGEIDSNLWRGNLKQEIIEKELLGFTKAAYDLLRKYTRLDDDKEVIAALEKSKPEDWSGILDEATFINFQEDSYGHRSYLKIQGKNLELIFFAVSLKMVGKILMEMDSGIFNLLSTGLQKLLSDFKLARSLRVYITG